MASEHFKVTSQDLHLARSDRGFVMNDLISSYY